MAIVRATGDICYILTDCLKNVIILDGKHILEREYHNDKDGNI
jgi:hypothetical protein